MFTEVVDMHFVTNHVPHGDFQKLAFEMPGLFILYYWLMKLQVKKTFFFVQYVLLDVQTPHSIDCMMIVIFDLVFFSIFCRNQTRFCMVSLTS